MHVPGGLLIIQSHVGEEIVGDVTTPSLSKDFCNRLAPFVNIFSPKSTERIFSRLSLSRTLTFKPLRSFSKITDTDFGDLFHLVP